jgi:hypothetical protein
MVLPASKRVAILSVPQLVELSPVIAPVRTDGYLLKAIQFAPLSGAPKKPALCCDRRNCAHSHANSQLLRALLRYLPSFLQFSAIRRTCSAPGDTNSNPYSPPSLCRTNADNFPPATGSNSTVSPTFNKPPATADMPLSLMSTLIADIAAPSAVRIVICALNRYRGRRRLSETIAGAAVAS